jgi:predicted dehydrogenase
MAVEFADGALDTVHASRWAPGNRDDLKLRIFGTKGALDVSYGAATRMACASCGSISA